MNDILVAAEPLRHFVETALINEGVDVERAKQASATLSYSDLAGLDTHGVLNLMSLYVKGLSEGVISRTAEIEVLRDQGAVVTLDAHQMLGLNAGHYAMQMAMDKAKQYGVGIACVRNSTHFGAAGYYAQMALAEDMIGMAMTNLGSDPVAHAMGSRQPILGTNPISFAAPVANMPNFLLDMSTTVCASGKIKQANARNADVSGDWLCNDKGEPVSNPEAYFNGTAYLPGLGGWKKSSGGHKGFGLNLMVEILSGVLAGADVPMVGQKGKTNEVGHFFLVMNIPSFMPASEFKQTMAQMLDGYLSVPTFDGFDTLQYAGQPDNDNRAERAERGIPIPVTIFKELNEYAASHQMMPLEEL